MWQIALLFHLLFVCSVIGVVKGHDLEQSHRRSVDSDEVVYPETKIHTCCDINLELSEANCGNWNSKKKLLPSKSWTFPRHMMAENVSTNFLLDSRNIKCQKDTVNKLYIPIINRYEMSLKFLKNGYLKVGTEYFPRDEYCINSKNATDLEVYVCPQECTGSGRPCIKKCCSLDKVYSFGANPSLRKGCQAVPEAEYFKPVFYYDYVTKSSQPIPEPHYIEHYPSSFKYNCPRNKTTFFLYPDAADTFSQHFGVKFHGIVYRFSEDGKILYKHAGDRTCGILDANTHDLCVDGAVNYHSNSNLTYQNHEEGMVMFLCREPPRAINPQETETYENQFGVVMLISSIFLFLTIATYVALWERQSTYEWIIVSDIVSLFFNYVFLGVAHIIWANSDYLNTPSCVGIGIVAHYFCLSTFCWLSLISIDLWLTFRSLTPGSSDGGYKGLAHYIKFSIGGWGIPLLIVAVGIILDKKFPEEHCHTLITPAYGTKSCFPHQNALGAYLYFPVAFMITVNLIFFVITTYKLYLYRQRTQLATQDDKQQFSSYQLFIKLFLIMGVLWVFMVFEVISWSASDNDYESYWIVLGVLNILRALAVFIILVFKRDIIISLEEKYPCLKPTLLPCLWFFKRRDSTDETNFSMNQTSTSGYTISSDATAESIGLMVNSHQLND